MYLYMTLRLYINSFIFLFFIDAGNQIVLSNDSIFIKPLFNYLEDINQVVLYCVLDYFVTFRYCWLVFIEYFTHIIDVYFDVFKTCWEKSLDSFTFMIGLFIFCLDIIIFRVTFIKDIIIVWIITNFLLKLR